MAKVKVKIKALKRNLEQIQKDLRKEMPSFLKTEIVDKSIKLGISPVAGTKRRYQKYSESYLAQMRGKAAFFTKTVGGKRFVVRVDKGESVLSNKVAKASGATDKTIQNLKRMRSARKSRIELIKSLNKSVDGLSSKRPTPRNLTLTGEMLKSFYAIPTGAGSIRVGFSDPKAVWHNEGATLWHGGQIPRRPMLPSGSGEKFSRSLTKRIISKTKSVIARNLRKLKTGK